MAVAQEIGSQYVFTGHAGLAREAGLSDETIRALGQGSASDGLAEDQATAVRYARELVRDHKVSDVTFQAALDCLGVGGTVELPPGMAPDLPQ